MIARGALHVHTSLSHDGRWSVAEMADFFRRREYQFVCMTEHSQDMNRAKVAQMRRLCDEVSSPDFCVIPGIEYSCSSMLHIAGAGCDRPLEVSDPARVARSIRDAGGFAMLAHPRRIDWNCPSNVVAAVNAIEAWNIGYDGKFLPLPQSLELLDRARKVNGGLLAVAGLDIHAAEGFYPASIRLTVARVDRVSILAALAAGDYEIESPLWGLQARDALSRTGMAQLRVLRPLLDGARSLRNHLCAMT
jgi:predicted metal-dependent phosphoesterase TrpH